MNLLTFSKVAIGLMELTPKPAWTPVAANCCAIAVVLKSNVANKVDFINFIFFSPKKIFWRFNISNEIFLSRL